MKFSKIELLWSRFGLTAKILIVFLALSILSLAVVGSLALGNIRGVGNYALESNTSLGDRAVNDSTKALIDQAETQLLPLAKDQADISNMLFERVEAETNAMADFASALWSNPSWFRSLPSYSQEEKPDDVYAASTYALAPGVVIGAVREELNLSSNMDNIFIPIRANDPNLAWVYIGTESGLDRLYPWSELPPTYDPRKRGWYQRAAETGRIGWTELYVDAAGLGLMVTCSKPVYTPDGEMVGVVGADVTLEAMNERIINTQVAELGYALVIDNNGNVVARPGLSVGDTRWDDSFEVENLLHSDNLELREIAERMTAGNTGIAVCRFEGGEKYFAYAPIASTNWSLGIVMPVEEIIAPALATESQINAATRDTREGIDRKISRMQSTFVGIFIAILLAVAGLGFLLSRAITRPILKITDAAQAMEKGELGEEDIASLSQSRGEDEVASLGRVFSNMAIQVIARERRLRQQVMELRIEIDEVRKVKQVAEITETEYFQHLRESAAKMREKAKGE